MMTDFFWHLLACVFMICSVKSANSTKLQIFFANGLSHDGVCCIFVPCKSCNMIMLHLRADLRAILFPPSDEDRVLEVVALSKGVKQ